MRIIITLLFLFSAILANGQSTRYWRKTIGYPGPLNFEQAQSIKQLSSGDYLIAGVRGSFITNEFSFMLKLDQYGNQISRVENADTTAKTVYFYMNLIDSGAIVAGWHRTFNPNVESPLIMKTDFNGDSVWTRVIASASTNSLLRYAIGVSDGGYIATGYRNQSISSLNSLVLRFDSIGQVIWDSVYVWPLRDSGFHIEDLTDGSFIISGFENSSLDSCKGYLQKIDQNGNMLWYNNYQYPGDNITVFGSGKPFSNGDFIVTGASGLVLGIEFPILAKMDSLGNLIWMKKVANTQGQPYLGEISRIIVLPDNSIVASGCMYHNLTTLYQRMTLLKTDSAGNLQWIRFITQDPTHDFYAYDVDTTSDGGFVISGRRDSVNTSYAYVVKTNCLGFFAKPLADFNVIWNGNTATFYNLSQRADTCIYHFGDGDSAVVLLTDTLPVVHTYSGPGPWNAYLVALACGEADTTAQSITTGVSDWVELISQTLNIYPNPATSLVQLEFIWPQNLKSATVNIMDYSGRLLHTQKLMNNQRIHDVNVSSLNNGSYQLVLQPEGQRPLVKSLIILK